MNTMERRIVLLDNKEYEVIATYKDKNNNKEFVVFTDNSYTNKDLNIYYGLYDETFIQTEIKKLVAENNK